MATVGLSMIVKNEAHVIERCLDSLCAEKLLDRYYVVDTGSTDGTQDKIRAYFEARNIAGEVVDYPFIDESDKANHTFERGIVDFRNMALEGLVGKVDYIFWIDADEQVQYAEGFDFDEFKSCIDNYDFAYFRCIDKGFMFRNNHLIRAEIGWEWHGIAHEFLRTKEPLSTNATTIEGIKFVYNEDGHSWKDKSGKIAKYVKLLTKQHEEEPTVGRWLFYLAQSYRAMETPEGIKDSIATYEKRIALYNGDGDDAEAYVSKLLSLCLRQQLGEKVTAKEFLECEQYDKHRIEHIMCANQLYWQYPAHESAYKISSIAVKKFMKPPYGLSELLINLSDYTFSCAHIHAINCFHTKRKDEGLRVLKALIDNIKAGKSKSLVSKEELDRLKNALTALR